MKGFKGLGSLITTLDGETVFVTYEWDEVFEEVALDSVNYKGTEVLPLITDEQVKELILDIYNKENNE